MRMIVRRAGADAHELAGGDVNDLHTRGIVEMRNDVARHVSALSVLAPAPFAHRQRIPIC